MRDRRFRLIICMILVVVLSGCVGDPDAAPAPTTSGPDASEQGEGDGHRLDAAHDPAAQTEASSAGDATLVLSGCHQLHTGFPARTEDFAARVPEGFSLVSDPITGLTSFRVAVDMCETASSSLRNSSIDAPVAQVWFLLPVLPPQAMRDDTTHWLTAATTFTSNEDLTTSFNALVDAGDLLETASMHWSTEQGASSASTTLAVHLPDADFQLTSIRSAGDGSFPAGNETRWITDGDVVHGRLHVASSASTNAGFGPITFRSTFLDEHPPLVPGTSHEVNGLTLTITVPVLNDGATVTNVTST